MKSALKSTATGINILTSTLGENATGEQTARRLANDTWDSVMATTTR